MPNVSEIIPRIIGESVVAILTIKLLSPNVFSKLPCCSAVSDTMVACNGAVPLVKIPKIIEQIIIRIRDVLFAKKRINSAIKHSDIINTFAVVYLSANLPRTVLPKKLPIKNAAVNDPRNAGSRPRFNSKKGRNMKSDELAKESKNPVKEVQINGLWVRIFRNESDATWVSFAVKCSFFERKRKEKRIAILIAIIA